MQTVSPTTSSNSEPVRLAASVRLKQAADEIVGSVFYGTMLRQLRSSTFKGKYGHGGRGEEVFQAQLDQVFAKEMGRSKNANISEAIVDRYERNAIHAADVRNRQQAAIAQAQHNLDQLAQPTTEKSSW
jgi:Rod binding domain-containing protein